MADNGNVISYEKLEEIDCINVDLIPEKKGLFIKHVEYVVTSKRFRSEVIRRYNDFLAFHELLLNRFPYRIIPKLPPKKIVGVFPGDLNFLENRRKALRRWLTLLSRHPIISQDAILHFFLTQAATDLHTKIKEIFKTVPDEFMTSEYSAKVKDLAPENNNEFAAGRDQIHNIQNGVQKFKLIADQVALRSQGYFANMDELGSVLADLAVNSESHTSDEKSSLWMDIKKGLGVISKQFENLSIKTDDQNIRGQEHVCEALSILLDVLAGHQELCDRVEKGVSHDHQTALSKLVSLKKRRLQGVLKGSSAESVAVLENRMLEQENVIASVELRTAFSLYCVRCETALVHAYLELLARILNNFVSVQISTHSQLADAWKTIQPTISKCLPKNCTDGL
ncbi:sorting nexin-8-like isoform X1 [Rhodnius prolixus]|uniref:PX domain-containing protein n=2 Tax=Rhodnius TaxID=13248 RepID=T1IAK3_RHOPR